NYGVVHTQQKITKALTRRGLRTTQATISRDIQELSLVHSGAGYRSAAALVRKLVLSVEVVAPMAVIRTPPSTANLIAHHIDKATLPKIANTVTSDDTIIAVLRRPGTNKTLKKLLANVG